MLSAFFYSARLFFRLWLQSFRRRQDLGKLTLAGRGLRLLLLVASLLLWLLHWAGLLLDEILFRGYRKVAITAPVFILGVPRSGTTFLHRSLAEDQQRFTSIAGWEALLAPSVTQRRFWLALAACDRFLGGPVARGVKWLERRLFSSLEGVHDVSLEAAEEDYLLLLPLLSCFILFLPFPESRHIWHLARFDWAASDRDKAVIMDFYKAAIRKHLYVQGKGRVYLSKNAAFASWPQTLRSHFPDARFLICMREPHKAVPSLLGSIAGAAEFFELELRRGKLPELLVEMMQDYYRHLLTAFPDPAPTVTMAELKSDIAGSVARLYAELGEELSPEYRDKLLLLAGQARQYKTRTRAIEPPGAGTRDYYEARFPWYYNGEEETSRQGPEDSAGQGTGC